ncbi:unnamed protein product [Spodoptera exigua]|nr:unnamed protein product [Spodoptera exigua]
MVVACVELVNRALSSRRGGGGGALFQDDTFPPPARRMRWLRPHELCPRPRFRGDDADGDHAEQLSASDRWAVQEAPGGGGGGGARLATAATALELTPRLLDRAVPPQSFRRHYAGAFRFRFWVFGEWRDVVVDDRLPGRAARYDFTLPLLEKAYAKLHGSYAALRGASVADALQALSGGVVQSFSLRAQPRALTLRVLQTAVPRSTLLVAHGAGPARGQAPGRAYVVAGLARVRGTTLLVRLRGPAGAPGRGAWAPDALGRGAWAPGSSEWSALGPHDRELLAPRTDSLDDFWMSFDEFAETFSQLELVHVGPDDWLLEPALQARRPWRAVLARRRWRPGYNAGGPPRCAETTGANPQFLVQIPASEGEGARKCHVVVSVTQQYEPGQRRLLAVGFALYALRPGARAAWAPALRPLDAAHEARAREVASLFALAPGRYLVVPHARAHAAAAFLLRVLAEPRADVWEVNDDNLVVRDVAAALHGPRPAAAPPAELDAAALRGALRRHWRDCLCAPPSLELCGALVALRDATLEGAMRGSELPALLALLAAWREAWSRAAGAGRCGRARRRASSYGLRALLREAGVTVSNKVLEALVLRFARDARLTHEAYVMALARLHVAHERFRSLDSRLKYNPVSLEEVGVAGRVSRPGGSPLTAVLLQMILMTIYS